jgi:hypothetical protein
MQLIKEVAKLAKSILRRRFWNKLTFMEKSDLQYIYCNVPTIQSSTPIIINRFHLKKIREFAKLHIQNKKDPLVVMEASKTSSNDHEFWKITPNGYINKIAKPQFMGV